MSNDKEYFIKCIKKFSGLCQNYNLYPNEHPEIVKMLSVLLDELKLYFQTNDNFSLIVVDNVFYFRNKPLINLSKSCSYLINLFKSKNFSNLVISKSITQKEILTFCVILFEESISPSIEKPWHIILREYNISNISLKNVGLNNIKNNQDNNLIENNKISKDEYNQSIHELQNISDSFQTGKSVDFKKLCTLFSSFTPQVLKHYEEILFLGGLKSHDENSFDHVLNVAILSCLLGAAISLPERILDQLSVAGFLHDIGKQYIPLKILNKPSKLNNEEMEIMKTHSARGAKAIFADPNMPDLAAIVAFEHHINYDMSGYPTLYRPREISVASKIVTIADFYDAVRGTRVYSGEMLPEEVYDMMNNSKGIKFDPYLLDIFFETIGVYPSGTRVLLDNNKYATVTQTNSDDIFRPFVKLIGNKTGDLIDLSLKENGKFIRSIIRSIAPNEEIST